MHTVNAERRRRGKRAYCTAQTAAWWFSRLLDHYKTQTGRSVNCRADACGIRTVGLLRAYVLSKWYSRSTQLPQRAAPKYALKFVGENLSNGINAAMSCPTVLKFGTLVQLEAAEWLNPLPVKSERADGAQSVDG